MKIDNKDITQVNSVKFLGFLLDAKLNWNLHINHIRKKIAKGIGIMCKVRRYFNRNTLKTLYYSLVYPYIHYGIEVWGSAPLSYMDPLIRLQKRIIRIICFAAPRTPSKPLFEGCKLLTINKVYFYRISLFMIKYIKGNCPSVLNSMFEYNSQYHNYVTRQHSELRIPFFHTTLGQRSVKYRGTLVYGRISKVIKLDSALCTIKKHLKQYLLYNDIVL